MLSETLARERALRTGGMLMAGGTALLACLALLVCAFLDLLPEGVALAGSAGPLQAGERPPWPRSRRPGAEGGGRGGGALPARRGRVRALRRRGVPRRAARHRPPGAVQVAERIRAAVQAETNVTVTLGVAERSAEDVAALLAKADQALYRGKAAGRNRVL